mmetsp:Transcript_9223/g.14184  ORF Transcript_9223/g.14184 Transcript_9223/m.14184 type:complete len:87 (-) Transcript_9223:89-349(-)
MHSSKMIHSNIEGTASRPIFHEGLLQEGSAKHSNVLFLRVLFNTLLFGHLVAPLLASNLVFGLLLSMFCSYRSERILASSRFCSPS